MVSHCSFVSWKLNMLTWYRPRRSRRNASAARKTKSTLNLINSQSLMSAHHPTPPSIVVPLAPHAHSTDRNITHSTKENSVEYAKYVKSALQRAVSDCLLLSQEKGAVAHELQGII
jgi:hypothetical protein